MIRLNLAVTEELKRRLDRMQTLSDSVTTSEVVRKAIAVYEVLLKAIEEDGCQVVIRDREGQDTILKIVW